MSNFILRIALFSLLLHLINAARYGLFPVKQKQHPMSNQPAPKECGQTDLVNILIEKGNEAAMRCVTNSIGG